MKRCPIDSHGIFGTKIVSKIALNSQIFHTLSQGINFFVKAPRGSKQPHCITGT